VRAHAALLNRLELSVRRGEAQSLATFNLGEFAMKTLGTAAVAALFLAAPLSLAPAFAKEMHSDMAGDAMHPMMPAHVTCKSMGTSDTGMMVEFHNMGKDEIPAGTTVHWMMHGMAQGDMKFMDAVAPGAMASQNYMMHEDMGKMSGDAAHMAGDKGHMSGDMMHMAGNAPCSVQMKQ
jgi:hypothetical protein